MKIKDLRKLSIAELEQMKIGLENADDLGKIDQVIDELKAAEEATANNKKVDADAVVNQNEQQKQDGDQTPGNEDNKPGDEGNQALGNEQQKQDGDQTPGNEQQKQDGDQVSEVKENNAVKNDDEQLLNTTLSTKVSDLRLRRNVQKYSRSLLTIKEVIDILIEEPVATIAVRKIHLPKFVAALDTDRYSKLDAKVIKIIIDRLTKAAIAD